MGFQNRLARGLPSRNANRSQEKSAKMFLRRPATMYLSRTAHLSIFVLFVNSSSHHMESRSCQRASLSPNLNLKGLSHVRHKAPMHNQTIISSLIYCNSIYNIYFREE